MNIILRELKFNTKSLIIWSICIILMIASGMTKYSIYQSTGESINKLLNQFPHTIQVVLGINGADISKASGYYSLFFLYIALLATIHSATLGANMISKEERDKTSEFLFVKPITRSKVLTEKLISSIISITILNIVISISSILIVSYYNKGKSFTDDILLLMIGLYFLQLIFLSLGFLVSSINRKPKSSTGITTGILLFTYIFSIIINVQDSLKDFTFLTPFKYFEAKNIINNHSLDLNYILLSIVIVLIAIIISYFTYNKRDLDI